MLQRLTLTEFLELAKTSKRIACYQEITADRLTPISIVESLHEEMQEGTILESGLRHEDAGRFSFIAFDKIAQLTVSNNKILKKIKSNTTTHTEPPLTVLRQLLREFATTHLANSSEFINSAVGFLTYDAIRLFEAIPNRHRPVNPLPDMFFNFYDTTLIFDHLQQKLLINVTIEVNKNPAESYERAQEKITTLITKMTTFIPQNNIQTKQKKENNSPTTVDVSDEEFIKLVERAKQYIIAGDAFQIVLSRRFTQQYQATPFDIYRALRRIAPAPYMFYIPTDDGIIVGASPEKLIKVRQKQVEVNPIAGTRPRLDNSHDEAIATELLKNEKEVAEHMMLVDLARNDLGRVCQPNSVEVSELLKVKHFSHVSHITSTVKGKLRDNLDALDALAAVFPAGTLSGAPKIRAMEIIDELETSKRGLYGGAICRLDSQGNLDSCIAIRMAQLKEGVATIRAGGGIVYDSDPQAEARETRQKAESMLAAIRLADEELA